MKLTNPKNGQTIDSPFTNAQALEKVGTLKGEFPESLYRAGSSGNPSPAQAFWIHKLAMENSGSDAIDVGPAFDRIQDYFEKARSSGLKWPRLTFDYRKSGGNKLVYSSTRDTAVIAVKRNGQFVGKLTKDGFHNRGATEGVIEFTKAIALDAFTLIKVYGLRTGNCCFCGRDLSTAESTAVGYGPICADKYGLPWGEEKSSSKMEIHNAE